MRTTLVEGVAELASNGERDLLIVFSHRDAEVFGFDTVTEGLGWARLLIRDPSRRGWYNAGLPGLGPSIEDIAASIRRHVDLASYRRTATLGSSMGGYAAILFGAMLGVDQVLAFNPQTTLDRLFPLSPPDDVAVQCHDLHPVVRAAQGTRFDLVIGDDDAVDLCHAAHLAGLPGVNAWTVSGSSHLVTEELHQRGELVPLLHQWTEGGGMEIMEPIPPMTSRSSALSLERAVLSYLAGDHAAAIGPLEEAVRAQPHHPGLSLFAGLAAARLGRIEPAIAFLRAALRFRPQWEHAREQLRLCLAMRGPMRTCDDQPESLIDKGQCEFEGIGQSIDAAVLDAMSIAERRADHGAGIEAEVVACGARITGIGGARSFWARVRTGAERR